jgi:hypothetical protein
MRRACSPPSRRRASASRAGHDDLVVHDEARIQQIPSSLVGFRQQSAGLLDRGAGGHLGLLRVAGEGWSRLDLSSVESCASAPT